MTAHFRATRGMDERAHDCIRIESDGVVLRPLLHVEGLRAAIKELDHRIELLNDRGSCGMSRDAEGCDVLWDARILRRNILGENSLGAHFPFQDCTLIETDEFCATLPWELVYDQYSACLDCDWAHPCGDQAEPHDPRPCKHDRRFSKRGPLAMLKMLGVRQGGAPTPASRCNVPPSKALVFGDADYSGTGLPPIDQREHLGEIMRLLADHYDVKLTTGANASRDALLRALHDPSYGAIYVYAHGVRDRSSIVTAGGDVVSPRDLPERLEGAPFLFLNVCLGGRDSWLETSGACGSIANELLQRGASSVVAPLCPVLNTHAARAAVEFFQQAVGTTVGRAMELMRQRSYRLYEEMLEPEISWFAYRLHGDPESCLPTRAWNSAGELTGSAFTPDAGRLFRVMQESAENRGDDRSTVGDLLNGLARLAGNLTSIPLPQLPPLPKPGSRKHPKPLTTKKVKLGAGDNAPEPQTGVRSTPLRNADRSLQFIFRNILHLLNERTYKAERINIVPEPISAAEVFDQCPVQMMRHFDISEDVISCADATPEDLAAEIRSKADQTVTTMLGELNAVNQVFTSGAAFLVQRIEEQARFCLSMAEVRTAVVNSFLDHFLIGNAVLRGQAQEVARLREMHAMIHRGRGKPDKAAIRAFLDELLKRALNRPDGVPVNEQSLYLTFTGMAMRRPDDA